jgi:hypothetical protein
LVLIYRIDEPFDIHLLTVGTDWGCSECDAS